MIKHCRVLTLLLLSGFVFSVPAQNVTAAKIERNVVYAMYSGLALTMDVYAPERPNGLGIIFIHGSGWSAELGPDARPLKEGEQTKIYGEPLVKAGYTVFAINHRAAPRFRYPAQVEDAQRAVRFVRHHAQRFGIDPARIGAVGGSSGGHLVSMLGAMDGKGDPHDPSPINRASAKVQCVVARAAPLDFVQMWKDVGTTIGSIPLFGFGLGTDKNSLEYKQYIEASPITYVSADDPPFLLLHGDADKVVPFNQSEVFEAALRKANVKTKLIRVVGGAHGPKFDGAVNPPDYIGEMIAWLNQSLKP
ncbi:MAG TPA: alpha/beta hydrolase [Blastocatellia bacterium]|nr:alpha/beta hydrolase [Blastocatellia bacterium]